MEFRLDDGQIALQDTVRRFCASHFPIDQLGESTIGPTDRELWKAMAAIGLFGLLVPEAEGGSGLGAIESAVVFEQLGAGLAPGPLLWTVLAAGMVAGAATGDQLVGGFDALTAEAEPCLVEHASEVDVLLVLRTDGVFACSRADLPSPQELAPLDPGTPVGRFDTLPAGETVGNAAAAAGLRELGTVLSAALLLGISATALEVARSYALEREQFGTPIGSFQAVKHLLADMYVRTALARSATYAAAAIIAGVGPGDAPTSVATAKLLAGVAAVENASNAVQILGGMGFTWAMPPNFLLKRALVLDQAFGTTDHHALAISAAIAGDAR